MNSRKVFAATGTLAGILFLLGGFILAAALCAPIGNAGSSGLHRWTPPDGQQLIVYSRGLEAYMTSSRAVVTAASVLILLGGSFIVLSRRLIRPRPSS